MPSCVLIECKTMLSARTLNLTVIGLASVWLAALVAAPFLMATEHALPALILYRASAFVCHQQVDRSFLLFGFPLAVCARCTGLSVGFIVGWCLSHRMRALPRRWLIAACLPTFLDWSLGMAGVWQNTVFSRTLTGALAGGAVAWWLRHASLRELRRNLAGEELFHG
jgi:uncharacterized membrane protein